MSVFISTLVNPNPRNSPRVELIYYLAGDDPLEAAAFVTRHGLTSFGIPCGRVPKIYFQLPKWTLQLIHRFKLECLKISEFDRRVCQGGGGIRTVDEQLTLKTREGEI